jgi:hypothetical protein
MSEEKKELTKQEERQLFLEEKQKEVRKILLDSGLFIGEVLQIIRNLSIAIESIKLNVNVETTDKKPEEVK